MGKQKRKSLVDRFEYERTDMTDKQREQYWVAVYKLQALIDNGCSKNGILSELEEDL
jgi:hypothetical protein